LIFVKTKILRVFVIRVLKTMFGTERDEVTGGWGRLHNEL
jgi:hypothetical protein